MILRELFEQRYGFKQELETENFKDEFTYGFEAEFVSNYNPEFNEYNLYTDIQKYEDIESILELYPSDAEKIKDDFHEWMSDIIMDYEKRGYTVNFDSINDPLIVYSDNKKEVIFKNSFLSWIENIGWGKFLEKYAPKNYLDYEINGNTLIVWRNQPESKASFDQLQFLSKQLNRYFSDIKLGGKDNDSWKIVADTSVKPKSSRYFGAELVSPVFDNYEEFRTNLQKAFKAIEEYGHTNETTGLHINIGPKDNNLEIDILKLNLLLGDDHIARMFGREANEYAKDIKNFFLSKMEWDQDPLANKSEMYEKVKDILNSTEKYRSINFQKLSEHGYLEFRLIGGKNYHEKFNQIESVVKRYIYFLNVASDPEFGKKAYLKKLSEFVLNSVDRIQGWKIPNTKSVFKKSGLNMNLLRSYPSIFKFKEGYEKWIIDAWVHLGEKFNPAIEKMIKNIVNELNLTKEHLINDIEKTRNKNNRLGLDMDDYVDFEKLYKELDRMLD